MPYLEGRYTINNGRVTVNTNTSGTYHHPINYLKKCNNTMSTIPFGWLTNFRDVRDT